MENIEKTLIKISRTLDWDCKELCDHLGLTVRELRAFKNNFQNIPLYKIYDFAEKLHLDPGRVIEGNIDFDTLYKHKNGYPFELPDRYTQYPKSRMRTVQNAIDFLEAFSFRDCFIILRKLQVSYASLIEPEESINVRLVDDIYNEMLNLGYRDRFFVALAKEGALNYKNCLSFYQRFKGIRTPKQLYENFFDDHIKYLDQNWDYKIVKSTQKEMTFNVVTNQQLQETVKKKHFGCRGFTMHRIGFAQGLFNYLGLDGLKVKLNKSIHDGHDFCQYSFKYA